MKVCGDGAVKGFGQTGVRRGLEQRFNCEEIRTCQRHKCAMRVVISGHIMKRQR